MQRYAFFQYVVLFLATFFSLRCNFFKSDWKPTLYRLQTKVNQENFLSNPAVEASFWLDSTMLYLPSTPPSSHHFSPLLSAFLPFIPIQPCFWTRHAHCPTPYIIYARARGTDSMSTRDTHATCTKDTCTARTRDVRTPKVGYALSY